ncbi:DUF7553 family protein [Haloarchaeobius sp. TZWWS8]|uniref:DUF7553 family protein n=1 Tax=Haloarchaeobius sp. TZWWS8 TaxID=3446121 RepID=UPI003EBB60D1
MSREHLQNAAELIREAAEATTHNDARERLEKQAEQFAKHAEAERGPDHGRLARHERILTEVAEAEGGVVEKKLDEALVEVREFRSTVKGV